MDPVIALLCDRACDRGGAGVASPAIACAVDRAPTTAAAAGASNHSAAPSRLRPTAELRTARASIPIHCTTTAAVIATAAPRDRSAPAMDASAAPASAEAAAALLEGCFTPRTITDSGRRRARGRRKALAFPRRLWPAQSSRGWAHHSCCRRGRGRGRRLICRKRGG